MIRNTLHVFANSHCNTGFLSLPNWHKGLDKTDNCEIVLNDLNEVWIIAANIADIVIHIAGLLSVVFIIYGGVRYITSQGDPENLQSAKKTIANAIVGLILAILASTIVGFIAGQF